MKKILYSGGSILTTDEVSDAVLRYAAALANVGRAIELEIPALDLEGEVTTVQIVIGPASQLAAENTTFVGSLEVNDFVRELRQRIEQLEAQAGVAASAEPASRAAERES